MDLSKLYFKKEIDPNSVSAREAIRKHHGGKNVEVENIRAESVPSYCVKIDFYHYNRSFAKKTMPYDGKASIPNQTRNYTPADFSFDDFPLQEISFDKEFDTTSVILKTQKLYTCPDCGGDGSFVCESCGGEGKRKCPRCKDHPGWILCPSCQGQKGRYIHGGEWRVCRPCIGDGKIACPNCENGVARCGTCNGTGVITCETCNGEGELVDCITCNDWNRITSKYTGYDDESLPESLSRFLNGKEDSNNQEKIERMLSFETPEPLIDSIDSPSDLDALVNSTESLQPVMSGYTMWRRYDHNCRDWPIEEDSDHKRISKILKVRTRIYQVHITRVTYRHNGKDCELWLYGKDNVLFEDSDLKRLLAEEKAQVEREAAEAEAAAKSDEDSDESDDEESVDKSVHVETISSKHRIIAMLLSLFLGFCGGHCFYVGKFWSGILRLAIFFAGSYFGSGTEEHPDTAPNPVLGGILVGIACLWMLVDFILICAGKYKDKHGAVIKSW